MIVLMVFFRSHVDGQQCNNKLTRYYVIPYSVN